MPLLAGLLAAGYFAWLRDSSLVAVEQVRVEGLHGPEAEEATAALTESARSMTTLNVDEDELAAAVEAFPTVVAVSADADLLHGLAIEVTERPPALIVESGGEEIPAAGDGTLLRGVELGTGARRLPTIALRELPPSGTLEGEAREKAAILGAAPEPLRPMIEEVPFVPEHGVEVVLEGGIAVRFGPGERAAAKWAAVGAVLADPELDTLTYLDVRVPERPAVGGAGTFEPTEAPVAPMDAGL